MEISHHVDICKVKGNARCFLYKPAFTEQRRNGDTVVHIGNRKRRAEEELPRVVVRVDKMRIKRPAINSNSR